MMKDHIARSNVTMLKMRFSLKLENYCFTKANNNYFHFELKENIFWLQNFHVLVYYFYVFILFYFILICFNLFYFFFFFGGACLL